MFDRLRVAPVNTVAMSPEKQVLCRIFQVKSVQMLDTASIL